MYFFVVKNLQGRSQMHSMYIGMSAVLSTDLKPLLFFACRDTDSGVLSLQFCHSFDGICHEAEHEQQSVGKARVALLYDLMHLGSNRGVVLRQFVHELI